MRKNLKPASIWISPSRKNPLRVMVLLVTNEHELDGDLAFQQVVFVEDSIPFGVTPYSMPLKAFLQKFNFVKFADPRTRWERAFRFADCLADTYLGLSVDMDDIEGYPGDEDEDEDEDKPPQQFQEECDTVYDDDFGDPAQVMPSFEQMTEDDDEDDDNEDEGVVMPKHWKSTLLPGILWVSNKTNQQVQLLFVTNASKSKRRNAPPLYAPQVIFEDPDGNFKSLTEAAFFAEYSRADQKIQSDLPAEELITLCVNKLVRKF